MRSRRWVLTEPQKQILWYLRRYGGTSRAELALALGVSNAKITSLSKELVALGMIDEADPDRDGVRGRPSTPLQISGQGGYAIGATIHPGWLEMAVVNFTGAITTLDKLPFTSDDPQDFVDAIKSFILRFTETQGLYSATFYGVGVGVPGHTDAQNEAHWRVVERLKGWRDKDIATYFKQKLAYPVFIENEATAATLAELYCCDILKKSPNAIVIYLGHGVGGGVVANRQLFLGQFRNAGEIGLLIPKGGPRPSGIDLIEQLRLAGADVTSLFEIDETLERFPDVVDAWVERAGGQLGQVILAGLAWMDPGSIVLSGSVPKALLNRLIATIETLPIWKNEFPHKPHGLVTVSELGAQAVVQGAALLPIHQLTAMREQ